MGAAVLRLTKFCAPRCMSFDSGVQVTKEEQACLTDCVKAMHNVTESTLDFFRDFENDAKAK